MNPHIYGTTPHISDSTFLTADELMARSGGNTGNLLFTYALSQMLGTPPVSIPWGGDLAGLNPDHDRLVVPLANQLGPHVDLHQLCDRFAAVRVPMVGVGLGAQGPMSGVDANSIPPGSWEWLRILGSKSASGKPNISVRGQMTYDVIAERGLAKHCVITGCPSNFINPSPTLGREIFRRRGNGVARVAIAAGNPFLPEFRSLEQSLLRLMEQSDGIYICQHPIDLIRLAKQQPEQITRNHLLQYRDYLKPYLDGDQFLHWFRRWGYTFASVPEWLTFTTRYDLVVGTRIHGVMAAIQAGVPGVCLCIDSRTLELCQTMKIPHLNAHEHRNGLTLDVLESVLRQWDWRAYDETRQLLAHRLGSLFRDNGLALVGAPQAFVQKRIAQQAQYEAKPADAQVHQVSTATFDGRYPQIFASIGQVLAQENPKVLSFGCSDGFEPNELASRYFHHSAIYGCDIDEDALRIARKYNKFPLRVQYLKFDTAAMQKAGPFDAILAMAVFCRWPDAEHVEDISGIYAFDKFADGVGLLADMLAPGGVLCVYNSNYRLEATEHACRFEVLNVPFLPDAQPVKLFEPSGRASADQRVTGILFRKR